MKLLITGANGQVGSELRSLADQYPDWVFVYTDYQDLDITDRKAVFTFFEETPFDYCINCAAYTAVDKAESEVTKVRSINVDGAENLALACAQHKTTLIHLSTDYVYHNTQNTPFKEGDSTNPQSVYGATKLEGEQKALAANPKTMIIRTSWVYSSFGHNFVKTMLRLGKERDKLGIVFDQVGTPTYARHLAAAMLTIIQKVEQGVVEKSKMYDLYHYSNEGVASWYDLAITVFEEENIEVEVSPIETVQYPTPAARPPFSLMNKAKIKAAFDIMIPHWQTGVRACLKALKTE